MKRFIALLSFCMLACSATPLVAASPPDSVTIKKFHCGTCRTPGWYNNDEGTNAYIFNNIGVWPDCKRHMWIVSIPECHHYFHGGNLYACADGMIWEWKWDTYTHDPIGRTATAKGHWDDICPLPSRWTSLQQEAEQKKFSPVEDTNYGEWEVIRQRKADKKQQGSPNWAPDTLPDGVIRR